MSQHNSDRFGEPVRQASQLSSPAPAGWGRLFAPVDIAFLAFFRVVFGAAMIAQVAIYVVGNRIPAYFVAPSFHFKYYGFEWVRPWGGDGMTLHFYALGVLALLILAGALYRLSIILFCLGFTYVFLLDKAYYQNHYYLICLLSLILVFLPANGTFSIDAWMRPKVRRSTVPAWMLWLLRAQIGIAYFYGGLAKLNADWLLGEPVRTWFAGGSFLWLGPALQNEWMVRLISYGGLALDLSIVPLLLWRPTRAAAYVVSALFHLANSQLLYIGIFPWFMIGATLIFFDPDWPRFGRQLRSPKRPEAIETAPRLSTRQKTTLAVLGGYLAIQLLVPLRHHLYAGDPGWTGRGDFFAWRMMMFTKEGTARYFAVEPQSGEQIEIQFDRLLNRHQKLALPRDVDLVLQFAHFLADWLRASDLAGREIRAEVLVSYNGRRPQLLVDPTVDLASVRRRFWDGGEWIMPLTEPLPQRRLSADGQEAGPLPSSTR